MFTYDTDEDMHLCFTSKVLVFIYLSRKKEDRVGRVVVVND